MSTRARAFRVYVVAGVLAAAVGSVLAGVTDGAPPAAGVLVFAALIVYSEHRSIEFAEGSAVNASFMVMIAAVVALQPHGVFLGPMIVAASRGLYLPQLRSRSYALVGFNAFTGVAGVAAAAAVFSALGPPAHLYLPSALITALLMAVACAGALWVTLAPGQVLLGFEFRALVVSFAPTAAESLPFCVLGFFLGWLYLSLGPAVLVLIIVPILIAREMFASYMHVKESHEETVGMLIRALEQKDHYTAGHAERVANYARYMGEELSFMPARLERLRFAALMHDIGKLVVPNHILNKPGRLTTEEFAQVRLHEKVGVQMLSHIDFLRPIAPTTHADAMRFDPDDVEHPIEPYIVMIADAYDAMTSTRAYRKALPQEVAFQELRDKAGIQFHPHCVEALIGAIERRGEKHGAGHEPHTEFVDAPDLGLGSAGLGDLAESESSRST